MSELPSSSLSPLSHIHSLLEKDIAIKVFDYIIHTTGFQPISRRKQAPFTTIKNNMFHYREAVDACQDIERIFQEIDTRAGPGELI